MSTKRTEAHHNPSKASEQAMHENDGHNTKLHAKDHVPGDELAHSHSHAAHLENNFDTHATPQGNQPADTRQDNHEPAVAHQTQSRTAHGKN